MGEPKIKQKYTVEEYFELDEKSELRYEYRNGEISAMAGSSLNHNQISLNLSIELVTKLRAQGGKCKAFMSEARVNILSKNIYYYPDVVVSCESRTVTNQKFLNTPILIAEVLSDSTGIKDMTIKMSDYVHLTSLQYYLLIAQNAIHVYLHERTDIGWGITLFTNVEDVISLPKLNLTIAMSDLYKDVVWEENEDFPLYLDIE